MKHESLRTRSMMSLGALLASLLPLAVGACASGYDSPAGAEEDLIPGTLSPAPASSPKMAAAGSLLERYNERLSRNPYGELEGSVSDLDGNPIQGVTVRIGGLRAVTDASGAYEIDAVPIGHYAVSFEHPDYVFAQRRLTVDIGESGWLTQQLLHRSQAQVFDADSGAIVKQGPLTLEFEPEDLVIERDGSPVHGDVQIVVTAIDPRERDHLLAAPAELEGLTVAGEQVGLISIGMLEVELFQGEKRVNVRRGETVKVALDVTEGFALAPGDSIPMWHHDTGLGIWAQERNTDALVEEQGDALVAIAELPHFSAWNYDRVADGVCAPLVVPANLGVSRVRASAAP